MRKSRLSEASKLLRVIDFGLERGKCRRKSFEWLIDFDKQHKLNFWILNDKKFVDTVVRVDSLAEQRLSNRLTIHKLRQRCECHVDEKPRKDSCEIWTFFNDLIWFHRMTDHFSAFFSLFLVVVHTSELSRELRDSARLAENRKTFESLIGSASSRSEQNAFSS